MTGNAESNTEPNIKSNINKGSILSRIAQLEQGLELRKVEYTEAIEELNKLDSTQEGLQEAFDQIKAELTKVATQASRARGRRDNLIYQGKQDRSQIEALKREFGRLNQLETDRAVYQAQVDELRERCLDAFWRAENRSDGLGALPHQIDGAIHLAVVKEGILGDKRGLGKTLTNLIWLDLIESQKSIIICPSDTMDNYIREIKMWTPHRRAIKLGRMQKGPRDFLLNELKDWPTFCLVINYEAWRRDSQLIEDLIALKADTLVEDEAHRAKTLSTVTCKGVTRIRFGANQCSECGSDQIKVLTNWREEGLPDFSQDKHSCKICGHTGLITDFCSIKNVMPMTGTPILNKPQEIFPHLRMIDVEHFHSQQEFLYDFCYQDYEGKWRWGHKAEEKLTKQIGSKYLARDRKSANVIIPPSTPVEHLITQDELKENYPEQYKAYKNAKEAAEIVFDPEKEYVMSMPYAIVQIMRLRQVLVWPAAITLEVKHPQTEEVLYSSKLDVHESAKLDKAEELIQDIIEEGERIVLFSQFKAPLKELQRRLGDRAVVYDGDTSTQRRNEIQLDFDIKTAPVGPSNKPRWDAVLCNYRAAGEGLNLNAASQMVILDEEWNPGRQEQALGRIDRLGQRRETQIHTIRVEKSIDTWMKEIIEAKKEIIDGFEAQANITQSMYDALRNGDI